MLCFFKKIGLQLLWHGKMNLYTTHNHSVYLTHHSLYITNQSVLVTHQCVYHPHCVYNTPQCVYNSTVCTWHPIVYITPPQCVCHPTVCIPHFSVHITPQQCVMCMAPHSEAIQLAPSEPTVATVENLPTHGITHPALQPLWSCLHIVDNCLKTCA